MITVVAKNIVKPERIAEYKEMARIMIRESRKEAGCIEYDLYVDMKEDNVLTFIERWKDEAAIAEHNKTSHYTTYIPKMAEFVELKEVRRYVVCDRCTIPMKK